MKTLVIASGNAGKIREFQGLLQALPVSVQPQPEGLEVEETGTTFAANARLKAQAVAAPQENGPWPTIQASALMRLMALRVFIPPATPPPTRNALPGC